MSESTRTNADRTGLAFQPLEVGPLQLQSRIIHPPHSMAIGSLLGSERAAAMHRLYWEQKCEQGPGFVVPVSGVVDNPVNPGFVPRGVGAVTRGMFRNPRFHERAARLNEVLAPTGVPTLCQLILNGGQPHGPTHLGLSGVTSHTAHPVTYADIEQIVEEFTHGAVEAQRAGFAGVELHACHDDLLEWFLSPLTNRREDEYGGDTTRRTLLVRRILASIAEQCGSSFAVGVRLQVEQGVPGGFGVDEALRIAEELADTGAVHYLHWVRGSNWGEHSYLPTPAVPPAAFAPLVGRIRAQIELPMVYTGRVNTFEAVEEVLQAGHADLVGVVRASLADTRFVAKARAGRAREVRPCVGCNDCLHLPLFEATPTACAVNPSLIEVPRSRTATPSRVLVIGGGPAGMECAALSGEHGDTVTLVEASTHLGGQLRIAAHASENQPYIDYIGYQERRLRRAGVEVLTATVADDSWVLSDEYDQVVVASGSSPRLPDIAGLGAIPTFTGREALTATEALGEHVVIVAEDDGMEPLTVGAHVAATGRRVSLVYRAREVASGVGRYSCGPQLALLLRHGSDVVVLHRVVEVEPGRVRLESVFGGQGRFLEKVDSLVLCCGGVPDTRLSRAVQQRGESGWVIGDAYAVRDLGSAIQQAAAVAERLATASRS